MPRALTTLFDLALDASPQIWVGALFSAFGLAVGIASIYRLIGRFATDGTPWLIGMIMAGILGAFLAGAGQMQAEYRRLVAAEGLHPPAPPAFPFGPPPGSRMTNHLFHGADLDGDGYLSPDEAAVAAADWVRDALPDGASTIDFEEFQRVIRRRMGPPGGPPEWRNASHFEATESLAAPDPRIH